MIGIDTGETENPAQAAAGFQARYGLTYPILLDSSRAVQKAYGVQAFPANIIIDRQGTVRYAAAGFDRDGIGRVLGELTRE